MSTPVSTPQAPEEVVTNAIVREVDLTPFGFKGKAPFAGKPLSSAY